MALRAQRKELELLLQCNPHIPKTLRGNPLRLTQVLVDLTSNAVKFTDSAKVFIIRIQLQAHTRPACGWSFLSPTRAWAFPPTAWASCSPPSPRWITALPAALVAPAWGWPFAANWSS